MFILLSLVGFKLLVTCSLRCEASSDLGMENAPGVSQQHLKTALISDRTSSWPSAVFKRYNYGYESGSLGCSLYSPLC